MKAWLGYDDALDTFGVHAVGGTLGALLTGIFATVSVNPNLAGTAATENGLAGIVGSMLWLEQLKMMGVTLGLALGGSLIVVVIVKTVVGLRIAPEVERQGLDINEHGEEGYVPG